MLGAIDLAQKNPCDVDQGFQEHWLKQTDRILNNCISFGRIGFL